MTANNDAFQPSGSRGLALLLSMAMFVLVVDTSFMNVSISAVASDLDATVSGVQTAIALEALVSAAFILISSKVADLIGRRRAYAIGLCGYLLGAVAMTLSQSLLAVIICWAIIGGLGASLLLPAMQSLIHGNFAGDSRTKAYALVGAAAAVAAAVGPLLGGFITTALSWRVGFLLEAVIIVVVLFGVRLVKDVAFTGDRTIDGVGAGLSVVGMGGVVLSILVWQEGGEAVGVLMVVGLGALWTLAWWLRRRDRRSLPVLLDPKLFRSAFFRLGVSQQMLQQIAIGGTMIVIPLFLQLALEYDALQAGLAIAPLSLSMFVSALLAGKRAGKRRPATLVLVGFALAFVGLLLVIPLVPRTESGVALIGPLIVAGTGLGLLVSQLNNYTLAPVEEERASEAAGVNSAGGSFGLSFGLAMAGGIMLATLSWMLGSLTEASDVIPAAEKQSVSTTLQENAEAVSDTQLTELIQGVPPAIEREIVEINRESRARALQVAMLVPVLACLVGLGNSFRMVRLPDPQPRTSHEGVDLV